MLHAAIQLQGFNYVNSVLVPESVVYMVMDFFTIRYTEVYNYYTLMTIINPMWLSTYIQAELRGIIGIGMVTQ